MCCIFGLLDYKGKLTAAHRLQIVNVLGTAAEVRGTDATGIAFFQCGRLHIQKAPKPAHKMKYRIPEEARYIMGHTRMTTQGSEKKNQNNHPFTGSAGNAMFALAHNGVLINDYELRMRNQLPKTTIETDSYVAVQLIEMQKEVSPNSLRRMAEAMEGHFTFTVLDQENDMYFIKGNNPLTIYHYPKLGVYLYASTLEILEMALKHLPFQAQKKEIIQPKQGEILRIDSVGIRTTTKFDDTNIRYNWWGYYEPPVIRHEDEYMSFVLDMGQALGVPHQDLQILSRAGYSAFDLEDLIYDEKLRTSCLEEVKRELAVW